MRFPMFLTLVSLLGLAAPAWAEPLAHSAELASEAEADHGELLFDYQMTLPAAGRGSAPGVFRFGAQGQWHSAFLFGEIGRSTPLFGGEPAAGALGGIQTWEAEAMAGAAWHFGATMVSPGVAYRFLHHAGAEAAPVEALPNTEWALGLGVHVETHLPLSTFGEGNIRYYPHIQGDGRSEAVPGAQGFQAETVLSHAVSAWLVPGLGYRYERWRGETEHFVFARLSIRPGLGG